MRHAIAISDGAVVSADALKFARLANLELFKLSENGGVDQLLDAQSPH